MPSAWRRMNFNKHRYDQKRTDWTDSREAELSVRGTGHRPGQDAQRPEGDCEERVWRGGNDLRHAVWV